MAGDPTFVWLHSPLAGPGTGTALAEELHLHGVQVAAPRIEDGPPSYWRSYADSAVEAITDLGADEVVLIPHSGAGALVACVADMIVPEVAGIIFVDAVLPADNRTRLNEIEGQNQELARTLRVDMAAGMRYPDWTHEFLSPQVPDEEMRTLLLAEMQPRGLDFFDEPIPAPGWPRERCAYLQLSPSYGPHANEAMALGWVVDVVPSGHFGMMVHPDLIAQRIMRLYAALSTTT